MYRSNPFRAYPLVEDFDKFKSLFEDGVDAYIINTGEFLGEKVTPEDSLGVIEAIVEGKAEFENFGPIKSFEFLPLDKFPVPFNDTEYTKLLKARMQVRLDYIQNYNKENPEDSLPEEITQALNELVDSLG